MKWYRYLKSTKPQTAGEDFADSVALIAICAILVSVIFLK